MRSGEYIQGKGKLTKIVVTSNYREVEVDCCLGVLCKIMNIPRVRIDYYYEYGKEGTGTQLPIEILDIIGLDSSHPRSRSTDSTLANLNDSCYTFPEIANIIEKDF